MCPTNDDLTLVIGGWPYAELAEHRNDVEATLMATFEMSPAFAERIRDAKREERLVGTSVPNYFRTPYGPGWALVGDAGYSRDFITAQGITDAFLDAEGCARRSTRRWAARRRTTRPWPATSPPGTPARCRSTR